MSLHSLHAAFVSPGALLAHSTASTVTLLRPSRCRLTGRPRAAPQPTGAARRHHRSPFACDKPQSTDRPEQGDNSTNSSSDSADDDAKASSSSSSSGGGGGGAADNDAAHAAHDIPQSIIDWNKSWAEFKASGAKTMAPEGREPIPKAELARQRASNRVRQLSDRMPSRQKLFADWRFWVAVVLTLSLFSAFVQSTSAPPGTVGTI